MLTRSYVLLHGLRYAVELSTKSVLMNVSRPAEALLHFICPLSLVSEYPVPYTVRV